MRSRIFSQAAPWDVRQRPTRRGNDAHRPANRPFCANAPGCRLPTCRGRTTPRPGRSAGSGSSPKTRPKTEFRPPAGPRARAEREHSYSYPHSYSYSYSGHMFACANICLHVVDTLGGPTDSAFTWEHMFGGVDTMGRSTNSAFEFVPVPIPVLISAFAPGTAAFAREHIFAVVNKPSRSTNSGGGSGFMKISGALPRVALASRLRIATARQAQPWAGLLNPFGVPPPDWPASLDNNLSPADNDRNETGKAAKPIRLRKPLPVCS